MTAGCDRRGRSKCAQDGHQVQRQADDEVSPLPDQACPPKALWRLAIANVDDSRTQAPCEWDTAVIKPIRSIERR